MASWSELPVKSKLLIIFVAAIAISGALYYLYYKPISDANEATAKQVAGLNAENDSLRPYDNKLKDLDVQIGNLAQQLEQMKQIVPDDKEPDSFIRMVNATANSSGIEVRSYTTKPTVSKEFFVEAPFDIELDGPYYSVLAFFDKMAKLERIINVSNLQMANVVKTSDAKVKHHYTYAPSETVVASCTATTYFSREAPAPAAKPASTSAKN
jgi:type IV pilus assembly protein PilO